MKLKPSQLKFLYDYFVLRCENDEVQLKYYYIRSKEVKALKKELNFEIVPIKPVKGISIVKKPQKNEFVFVNDKNSTLASLFHHIRNVFVHNRVYILDTGEVELIDVVPPKTMKKAELEKLRAKGKKRPEARITMYSKFSSFDKLKKILQELLETQQ